MYNLYTVEEITLNKGLKQGTHGGTLQTDPVEEITLNKGLKQEFK